MQTEQKERELTPKEKLKNSLNYSIRQYRIAVRWLRDARIYRGFYSGDLTFEGKSWKDTVEGELATDASRAYREATAGVLFWRKKINHYNNKLIELSSKEKDSDGKNK